MNRTLHLMPKLCAVLFMVWITQYFYRQWIDLFNHRWIRVVVLAKA